jgi:sarcosine oxidase subunit beta
VTDISTGQNGITVAVADGRRFDSDVVINCAGAWGSRIALLVNDHLPIRPEGLSMMVTARMPRFIRPVVGVHGRKLSFKQTANGTVVIGGAHRAILDKERDKTVIDFGEMKQSAATVLEHFPVMRQTSIVRCWAGIEGMMRDGLPAIGESTTTPGLFHVCGFSAHGFQLSPMVGRLAAALAMGRKPEISLEAFSVNRFN